jgi:hypothetical protein
MYQAKGWHMYQSVQMQKARQFMQEFNYKSTIPFIPLEQKESEMWIIET